MLRQCVMVGFLILACQSCQNLLQGQESAKRTEKHREGKSALKLIPVNPADSLEQLVSGSELIVDCTVGSTHQPVARNASERLVIVETHAIVLVNTILKGSLPKEANSVLVAQAGGRSGASETEVDRDGLLEEGSRYVLFLQRDDSRAEIVNNTGLSRFGVVGVWSGKAKISDGRVQFLPSVSKALAMHNGQDVLSFGQRVRDLAAGKYISPEVLPAPPLPPHPGPPAASRK